MSTLIISLLIFLGFRSNGKTERKLLPTLPPGNLGGWPFIGDTIPFMTPHSSALLGTYIDQNISKYGRIFRMNLLGKATIVSVDPDFNRYILQNEGRLFENSCPTSIKEILGKWSMLALAGDIHREMRSIAVNFMNSVKLRTYFLKDIDIQAVNILDAWKVNSTFSAQDEGKKFAFNLMVKHLMNMDPGMPETEEIRKEYIFFMEGMASIPLNFPGTAYRRALQSRSRILAIMGQKLDERMQKIKEGCKGLEEEDLLASVARNTNITRDQILDLMISMLFAGHETSSAAISLAIYFLQASPDVLKKLREEHIKIAKQKKERGETELNWDDYKQMIFTNCVIHETLRLGNIVKFLHRKTIKDVQYKGYEIPCGWEVVPIISAAHLDSSIFDNPQSYDPSRWEAIFSAGAKSNIMSFSGGPRLCPGAELAKLEMAIFLHHLVQRFDWELVEKDNPVSFPFLGFPKKLPIKITALKH